MVITPKVINFEHKKGALLPPERVINYDEVDVSRGVYMEPKLPMFTLSDVNSTNLKIGLNLLAGLYDTGHHLWEVNLFYNKEKRIINYNPDVHRSEYYYEPVHIGKVDIHLKITEAVLLDLSLSTLNFSYLLGNEVPVPININVTSENKWTVVNNSNWISLSETSGVNNGNFKVSITPNGLSPGSHVSTIVVNDGVTTKELSVTLLVSEENGIDYLYVNPLKLNFGYTISGVVPISKRIELNSSGNWKVTTNKDWVRLSVTKGSEGAGALDIGIHNLKNITKGRHYANVIIQTGDVLKTVSVLLDVYSFTEETLEQDKLYFTDDYTNVIKASSGRNDTHLQIKVSSNYYGYSKVVYNLPFYKGVAEKRIGLEAKRMLRDLPLIKNEESVMLLNPYKPIELSFEINERALFADENIQTIHQHNIEFIKGITPINKWLSEVSTTIFATPQGIVQFSFLGFADKIEIIGAVNKSFSFSNNKSAFYTAIIPLKTLNLKVGDEITIKTGSVSVTVVMKPSDKEQTFIYWENKWGCFDVFECTGRFIKSTSYKDTSFDFRKDFKTIETKVLSVQKRDKYSLDSGYVYSDDEIQSLQGMLSSRNIYLVHQGKVIQVKSTTKKLEVYKTQDYLRSFGLTFENKEQL